MNNMKILIDNRTDATIEDIGKIIDDILFRERNTTQYYGKWKSYTAERKGKTFKIETLVMKKYFKILIMIGE